MNVNEAQQNNQSKVSQNQQTSKTSAFQRQHADAAEILNPVFIEPPKAPCEIGVKVF